LEDFQVVEEAGSAFVETGSKHLEKIKTSCAGDPLRGAVCKEVITAILEHIADKFEDAPMTTALMDDLQPVLAGAITAGLEGTLKDLKAAKAF
jgi:hypothetical protein